MSGHGNHAEEAVTRAVVSALAAAGMRILDVDARDSAVIFVPDKGEDPVRLSLESLRAPRGRDFIEGRDLPGSRYGYGNAVTITPETAEAIYRKLTRTVEETRERAERERVAEPTPEEYRRIRAQVEGILSDQLESALTGSDEGQGAGAKVETLPVR